MTEKEMFENLTEEVFERLKAAAEQGDAKYALAQNTLGVCYYTGHFVAQSYAEAVEWFRKAAEQGNANAQDNLNKLKSEVKND